MRVQPAEASVDQGNQCEKRNQHARDIQRKLQPFSSAPSCSVNQIHPWLFNLRSLTFLRLGERQFRERTFWPASLLREQS